MLFLWLASSPLAAQTDMAAYERITTATDQSALVYVPTPYHLQLHVTVVGAPRTPDQDVTIDRWQSGDDYRMVMTTGAVTETRLQHNGKHYHLLQGGTIPALADAALQSVLHPGPYPKDLAGTIPDRRKQGFGKLQLDCVMLDLPMKGVMSAPSGLFPTYCLNDSNDLMASFNAGSQTFVQNSHGRFLDHDISAGFTLLEGPQVVARGKVAALGTYQPKPDEFEPTPELVASAATVELAGSAVAGRLVSKVNPIYPDSAKADRASGTVVLKAVIGQDGHVHFLRPVSANRPDLTLSAINAVRQWVYAPYLVNGEPAEVSTTITVNYNLN